MSKKDQFRRRHGQGFRTLALIFKGLACLFLLFLLYRILFAKSSPSPPAPVIVSSTTSSSSSNTGFKDIHMPPVKPPERPPPKVHAPTYRQLPWPTHDHNPFYELLHSSQYPMDCADRKFLVWEMPKRGVAHQEELSLGTLAHLLWRWVILGMTHNRTVVLDSRRWTLADCDDENGWLCYFEPFSSCTMEDVETALEKESSQVVPRVWEKATALMSGEDRVLKIPRAPAPVPPTQWLHYDKLVMLNIRSCEFPVSVWTYFLRPNDDLKESISRSVTRALPADFNPKKTIGMPIRGCHKKQGKPEDGSDFFPCPSFDDYMAEAEKLRASHGEIDSIVITSEDADIIAKAKEYKKTKWRFIYNIDDVLQGPDFDHKKAREFELYEMVRSILTSVHLQLQTKYLVANQGSSLTQIIGILHQSCDGCCAVTSDRVQHWIYKTNICEVVDQPVKFVDPKSQMVLPDQKSSNPRTAKMLKKVKGKTISDIAALIEEEQKQE